MELVTQTPNQGQADKSGKSSFRKRLLLSIKQQNNAIVKSMLKNFNFRHAVKARGATLLHCAATYGNVEITEYLLSKGFNVDAQDLMGRTPLMKAVMGSHYIVTKTLLAAGADIDILNDEGKSVLHDIFANHKPSFRMCQLLLQALRIKYSSSEEIARILINAGCQVYQANFIHDTRIIECMIEHGSPVDSIDPLHGYTALHIAFIDNDVKIVKLLLKHGADIEALDIRKNTPLEYLYQTYRGYACDPKKLEILKLVSDRGVLPKFVTPSGIERLHGILISGSCKQVHLILQSTINFAVKEKFTERTILHYFAMNGNSGIAEVLECYIEKFDVNALDRRKRSPLTEACERGNPQMVKFLLDKGAEIDGFATNPYSIPLHVTYSTVEIFQEYIYDECAELLFEYNADPQVIGIDNDGHQVTIFDAAMETEHFDRIELAIARLTILERQGTPITELIRSKIDSHQPFKKYFRSCRKILGKKVMDSITVFKLLTESDQKIVRYLRNEKLVKKLVRISYKNNSYLHVFKRLGKRLIKAFYKMRLQNKAASQISNIFNGRVDESSVIVEKIIEYLDDETLQCICKI